MNPPSATVSPRTAGPTGLSILTRWGSRGTATILGIGALVLVLIGATIGLAFAHNGTQTVSISAQGQDPVDTGFARDMVVHHTQGVTMAHIAELNSTDTEVRSVAYDIEYTQTSEIGTMNGWLDLWGVPRLTLGSTHMSWMGSTGMADMHDMTTATTAATSSGLSDGAVMPGMATDAEIAKLQSLKGKASDIYFLQLMVRHHEGGAAMMTYAANHALSPVVQNFASKMLEAQTSEVGVMTGMLSARGAKPLAFTAPTG
ncbi:Uncharacterized conserved protein, DUF305 family [Nakamurella panacisegetis]|uniref:Uncharacterized conserved protein, DUF305 family n=1 Tax=Nakamurella panacisegetis TaxID=1090615 RepID=A0A1H0SQ20_9ACTN|nr:Uncharacterized conserved protein, DUF305 family [Nakamurella panacisegetis]